MELTQLRYFQVIVCEGTMTAAARVLGVSQPTLSVAIRNLEEELDTKLFSRTRDGMELTSTGRALQRGAEGVFAQVRRIGEEIRELEEGESGAFVLGCHESLGAYFLPGFLPEFMQSHPGLTLQLWNGSSAEVREAVLDRRLSFGLVVNTEPHPELVIQGLFQDRIQFFGLEEGQRAGQREGQRDEARLARARARLEAGPLLYADRPVFREVVGRLAQAGIAPGRPLVCGDLELVKSLALSGAGVALLPSRVARYNQDGRLRPLHPGLPWQQDDIHLVFRADLHRTRAALRVKEALAAHGQRLAADTSFL